MIVKAEATAREREGAAQLFLRLSYERSLAFRSMRMYMRHTNLYLRTMAAAGTDVMDEYRETVDKDWQGVILGPTAQVSKAFADHTLDMVNATAGKAISQFEADIADYLQRNAVLKADTIARNHRVEIRELLVSAAAEGLSEREIGKRIRERMQGLAVWQGRRIARTEIHHSSTYAAQEAAKSLSLKLEKEWLTAVDGRERDRHGDADGERVPMDEPYTITGLMRPGDPTGEPKNIINCRCGEIYHRVEV